MTILLLYLYFVPPIPPLSSFFFFFFNDTATTEIYTLSLHDALPICHPVACAVVDLHGQQVHEVGEHGVRAGIGIDRKSTRLNSSHLVISYAVFCLKKKKRKKLSGQRWMKCRLNQLKEMLSVLVRVCV